jgi:hypothetical protein
MAIISRGIGWSQESNLLWYILKQLNQLTGVLFGLKPKYKVYTALLTQSGGNDPQELVSSGSLTVGVTYLISDNASNPDFTNVGAPNNNVGTYFVATGTTPNNWGTVGDVDLGYNGAAPTVIVLENTIGNIWWTYSNVGYYFINSDNLFISDKTFLPISNITGGGGIFNRKIQTDGSGFGAQQGYLLEYGTESALSLITIADVEILANDMISAICLEIRVYN